MATKLKFNIEREEKKINSVIDRISTSSGFYIHFNHVQVIQVVTVII